MFCALRHYVAVVADGVFWSGGARCGGHITWRRVLVQPEVCFVQIGGCHARALFREACIC